METLSYKCPSCDAALKYDGTSDKMTCEYCGCSFDVESVKAFNEATEQTNETEDFVSKGEGKENGGWEAEEAEHMGVLTCPTCGGELIFEDTTVASSCPYCGNPAMVKSRLAGELKPDIVLPFKKTKEEAKEALAKFAKKKILLPKFFASESRLDSIKGIYLPFWLYSCTAEADATYSATRVFTTRTPKYDVVRTDHYSIARRGTVDFKDLPVDGSSKIADALMDSIEPFDLNRAEPFTTAYLSGFFADKYDESAEKCSERAKERMKNTSQSMLRGTVNGYATVMNTASHTSFKNTEVKYALLPVWLLVTEYKEKKYTYAMNGQTGKFVGELPVSAKRFWAFTLGIGAGLSLLLYLGYNLLLAGGMI